MARLFSLKQHNPSSHNISKLESQLKSLEEQRKNNIIQQKQRNESKAIRSVKSNPTAFYKYCKKFSKTKSRIGPLKHHCGSLTSDPTAMANLLQGQFASVYSDPNAPEKQSPAFPVAHSALDTLDFNIESFVKAIDEMSSSSAPGEDGFPSCLLKSCKASVSALERILQNWFHP